jgi:hypothetical protein
MIKNAYKVNSTVNVLSEDTEWENFLNQNKDE